MDDETFIANLKLDFDPDALREKYRQERDKRVRADGNDAVRRGRPASSPTTPTTPTSSRGSPARR